VSWPTVLASELMLKRGGAVNPANYPDETFELLSIPAFDRGEPEIVEGKAIGSPKSCVQPNDVLLSKIVPHIKRCWVVPDPQSTYRQIGSGEWIIFRSEKVHPPFLRHFLTSDIFHRQFMNTTAGVGGSLVRARPAGVGNIDIPLPPLPEQKRIAAILDKADAIRCKRQQAIQLADDFLSAQFLRKFGDPKDSPFGSRSLKDVALKVTDGAHFTPTYVDSGIPFLRVTDINRGEVDWSKVKYIPLEEHQELIKRCKPEKGDVLYSKNGTIGVPRLVDWDQEFSIFVSLCLIKPDPNYLRGRYLYSFLQTPFALKQATQKAKSATVTNLHLVEIKEIKLPVPSLAIQDEWIDFVDNFGCMRARLIGSLNKSNDAFNSLSQKAFSGLL